MGQDVMSDLRKRYCCDGMYMKSVYSFKYSIMETWILEICCRSWDLIANRSSLSTQQSCSGCGISPAGTCFEEIKLCVGLRRCCVSWWIQHMPSLSGAASLTYVRVMTFPVSLKVHIDGLKRVFNENYFAKQEDLRIAHKTGVAHLIEKWLKDTWMSEV